MDWDSRREWGASGLASLTGVPSGPPDYSRAGVLVRAKSAAQEFNRHVASPIDVAELLVGRAGLLGLSSRGQVSAGGASRLMDTRRGWCALTLSRPEDLELVPALVESSAPPPDPWLAVERWAALLTASEVVDRARLLGLPAAVQGEAEPGPPVVRRCGPPSPLRHPRDLLVADLSSMWAGPLCGQLLGRMGATVVKVESRARPDGTRAGSKKFFDWMNGEKLSYRVDLGSRSGLTKLLEAADVVIESSRPAALRRRRLGPADVPAHDGRVWVRITGHGSDVDAANWTAFGDDAAVAGGLVGTSADGPVFCGDAIADPLTGLHAALAVTESLARGGGELIEVALSAVSANYGSEPLGHSAGDWVANAPSIPQISGVAPKLGADNARVEELIAGRLKRPC